MSSSELVNQDPFRLVKSIVFQLKELNDQNDINLIVFKLQSMGYILSNIRTNGYGIIGDFRNKNFNKEIQIPYYKVDEDILVQLYNIVEEYRTYRSESEISKIQVIDQQKLKNFDFDNIDWSEIYKTPDYVSLFLDVTIELLFSRLNEYLKKAHRLDEPSLN